MDLRQRLVFSGVHISLTVDIMENAMKRANVGSIYFEKRTQDHISYFRDPSFIGDDNAVPLDQRKRMFGIRILPSERDFLKSHEKVIEINNRLLQLSIDTEEHQRKVKKEKKKNVGAHEDGRTPTAAADATTVDKPSSNSGLCTITTTAGDDEPAVKESASNCFGRQSTTTAADDAITFDDSASSADHSTSPVLMQTKQHGSHIKGNEAYGIFDVAILTSFIHEATSHAAKCQTAINLDEVDKTQGAGIIEYWECPKCNAKLELHNCKWIKSVVESGRKYSKSQPELNMKLVAGARLNGVNMEKLHGLVSGSLGIKMSNRRNVRHAERKVRDTIKTLYKERTEEFRAEHVEASKLLPDYEPIEFEYHGVSSVATPGKVSCDGAGSKRAFRHNITSSETATIIQSETTKKPLALVHSRVSVYLFFHLYF